MDKQLIGKWVKINKMLLKARNYREVVHMVVTIEPKIGLVAGFRHLPFGYIGYSYDDPGEFFQKGIVPCILVVTNPYHNPTRIPLDGFELLDGENE